VQAFTWIDQPQALPSELRNSLEAEWKSEVCFYALSDLDDSLSFSTAWVALGQTHLSIAREGLAVETIEVSRIREVRESRSLSCNSISLLANVDEAPLATLRFTNRQRKSMDNVIFALKQELRKSPIAGSPDELYAKSVLENISAVQRESSDTQWSLVKRLLSYLRPYEGLVTVGIVGAVFMTLLTLVPGYLTGYLIDHILRPFEAGQLPYPQAIRLAWIAIAGIAVSALVREFFSWLRFRYMSVLGENVARDLRSSVYSHLQKLNLSYFSKRQTGSLITRVSTDTERIWDFIALGVVEAGIALLTLVSVGSLLLWLDWKLGLLVVFPVPIFMYLMYRHGEHMQKLFLRAWRKWSDLTDVLSDTLPGIRVVKVFHQERSEIARFDLRNSRLSDEMKEVHFAWSRFWPLLILGIQVMVLFIWGTGLPRVLAEPGSEVTLSIGTFISFLFYVGMFIRPIEVIGQMTRTMHRATSSAQRIFEVLDAEPEILDNSIQRTPGPLQGAVRYEGITFSYDGLRRVLKNISFEVRPGEMIGLVGPSGSGKSTLINLLARFHEPLEGSIHVDGKDIRELEIGAYRRQIGMVLQEPFLFHGSVLDNIRYGHPEAPLAEVVAAAKAANAHDFICRLSHGYDTQVGERGHTLSGGERQRISIARALLHNPRILILDEATSSVDTETERKIQQALDRLVVGRTVFAIAHRLSTLTKADRLLVLDQGAIVEQGTHAELLAKAKGLYRRLHDMQREMHDFYAV
jgi:ATP-binding cassette, subfamily B, bacterial